MNVKVTVFRLRLSGNTRIEPHRALQWGHYVADWFRSQGGEIGWFDRNAESTTHAIKGKAVNSWGLDMSGNVWKGFGTCMGSMTGMQ